MRFFLLLLATCLQLGCESGDDRGNSGTPAEVKNKLVQTNLDESNFPWQGWAPGRLKAWDIAQSGPIPVKTNGIELAEWAMDDIEGRLGMALFDRQSIADRQDEAITRGIIVVEGTALGPNGVINGNSCGHVSAGVGTTSYPNMFYDPDGVIDTVLYLHLSSAQCSASLNVAIHEFGHALGVGGHFEGFGIGPAISRDFWNVLYNIYRHEVGANEAEIQIEMLD